MKLRIKVIKRGVLQKNYFNYFILFLICFPVFSGCGTSQCEVINVSDTETQDTNVNDVSTDITDEFCIYNACGGDELLFADPGDSCGSCSRTHWQCEETNLVCSGNCNCETYSNCAENEWCSNNVCVDKAWAYIPAGTFIMGAPDDEIGSFYDVMTQHQVTLTQPFLMSRYEVTIGEYLEIRETLPEHTRQILSEDCNPYPLDEIYWFDAIEYINARSEQEGLESCYVFETISGSKITRWDRDCLGYRLPTEAEWEYAARAGTTTATYRGDLTMIGRDEISSPLVGYAWCFEEDPLPEIACSFSSEFIEDPTFLTPHLPGLLPPNPWGLYDILGNVREQVFDDFRYNEETAIIDPPSYNAMQSNSKISRGGNVNDETIYSSNQRTYCRSAARHSLQTRFSETSFVNGAGIRLVRSLPVLRESE